MHQDCTTINVLLMDPCGDSKTNDKTMEVEIDLLTFVLLDNVGDQDLILCGVIPSHL